MITYRMLPLEEWDKLEPLYTKLFPDVPFPANPTGSAVQVAELDGKIVAFWFMHLCAHAEPVGVDPIDGKGVNLLTMLDNLNKAFRETPGMEYYITAADSRIGDILEKLEFKPRGVLFSSRIS
jgi:hypothetical protein